MFQQLGTLKQRPTRSPSHCALDRSPKEDPAYLFLPKLNSGSLGGLGRGRPRHWFLQLLRNGQVTASPAQPRGAAHVKAGGGQGDQLRALPAPLPQAAGWRRR